MLISHLQYQGVADAYSAPAAAIRRANLIRHPTGWNDEAAGVEPALQYHLKTRVQVRTIGEEPALRRRVSSRLGETVPCVSYGFGFTRRP